MRKDDNHDHEIYENDIDDLEIEVSPLEQEILKNPNSQSEVYDKMYNRSINPETRLEFFSELAKEVAWDKFPETILCEENAPFFRWYPDGRMNACYNCIDKHIKEGRGENVALIGISCYTNLNLKITYNQLLENVSKTADMFLNLGARTGDTIIIYMPMILEAIYGILACARLGITHSIVFGGFAADELAERIFDAKPVILYTASCGIEPRKKIPYYPIVISALNLAKGKFLGKYEKKPKIILHQRENVLVEENLSEEYETLIYKDLLEGAKSFVDCVFVLSNHPLYILYTSGTTGTPKGIVRETGGHIVMLNWTLANVMDIDAGDVYFSTSDIGWVVGHNYIVYGPLVRGATSIIFEGKPVGTPHCGVVWEIIQNNKVKCFYTAPTAVRAIRREDSHHTEMKKWDISSLKSIHLAGERCDPESIEWLQAGCGESVLINDNYWQTETGYAICANNIRIHTFPTLPGSTTKPIIGQNLVIYDKDRKCEITEKYKFGYVYIKLPLAPSFMLSLWNNDDFFKEKYITKDNKYYITGDAGYFDANGYFHIMTRLDDIINVAGHRLSTGRMEEVLLKIEGVSEVAVVSINDELKKEIPFAFVALNSEIESSEQKESILKACKDRIVVSIGAISRLKDCVIVNRLPKTRSGKILRSTLKKILNREPFKMPATIDDPTCLDEITEILRNLIK